LADGSTKLEALTAIWTRTKRQPEELANLPRLPRQGRALWADFLDLHLTRRSGLNGPERLSFADLQAWQIVTASTLAPWEIRAILALDRVYMATVADAASRGA